MLISDLDVPSLMQHDDSFVGESWLHVVAVSIVSKLHHPVLALRSDAPIQDVRGDNKASLCSLYE